MSDSRKYPTCYWISEHCFLGQVRTYSHLVRHQTASRHICAVDGRGRTCRTHSWTYCAVYCARLSWCWTFRQLLGKRQSGAMRRSWCLRLGCCRGDNVWCYQAIRNACSNSVRVDGLLGARTALLRWCPRIEVDGRRHRAIKYLCKSASTTRF